MAYDTILLRYGEIFLKGKNKDIFERKLAENIRKITENTEKAGGSKLVITRSQSRLLTGYFAEHSALRRVFGLVSYSPAVRVEKNAEEIKQKAAELLRQRKEEKRTFRVSTKRSDKTFPVTSPEFNRVVGKYIEQETDLLFSSASPEIVLEIEINQEGAYLFFETIACSGGLPTGVEGRVLLLLENEASLLAGLLFMKRGCSIFPVAFEQKDISLLQAFSPAELHFHQIKSSHSASVFTSGSHTSSIRESKYSAPAAHERPDRKEHAAGLLTGGGREYFDNNEELEQFAAKKGISVLVTGQILDEKLELKTDLIVMKPLIAYSKKQISDQIKSYQNLVSKRLVAN